MPDWKKYLFSRYRSWKYHAIRKKLTFNISFNLICRIYQENNHECFYSKRTMLLEPNSIDTISLDRIDSSIGYEAYNVVLCSSVVNKMKLDLTKDEFAEVISSVYDNISTFTQLS